MNQERYQRQAILKGFGEEGQAKLAKASVLVIGAGGLGVPVLMYLNAMGVGTLGIVDNDSVSISNLHRQVIYTEKQVGQSKVAAIKEKLKAQNSSTSIHVYHTFLNTSNALEIIEKYDLVVDASDNFPTRYLVNDTCVVLKKPLVYGALHGFEGQVSVFNFNNGPTYRCLYPTMPKPNEVPNCNEHGVLGILPGIIGNLQALEAVKVIAGIGDVLSGIVLLYDGLTQRVQRIKFDVKLENLNIRALAKSYDFQCDVPIKSVEAIAFNHILVDNDLELIDVRSRKEFKNSHLKGAKNIPLDLLKDHTDSIDLTKPVYLICQSGIRSQKAILLLQELFPKSEFINVVGGMNQINSYANTH
ncbi:molybdopterin-synthase adenylyltransferase MoeB [Maribacter sp. CXY002]|uniref:molybdopterin-synthase adenylyltransferase MoeB n=1 Tax=Maribacter luteocoastalis TaxID=3407671 RepID=UPI003B676BC7